MRLLHFQPEAAKWSCFTKSLWKSGVVAPRLSGPTEEEGERLDAAESTRSEGRRGLQVPGARSLIHVGVGASACTSKRDFSRNPCEPGLAGPSCGGDLQERGTEGGRGGQVMWARARWRGWRQTPGGCSWPSLYCSVQSSVLSGCPGRSNPDSSGARSLSWSEDWLLLLLLLHYWGGQGQAGPGCVGVLSWSVWAGASGVSLGLLSPPWRLEGDSIEDT